MTKMDTTIRYRGYSKAIFQNVGKEFYPDLRSSKGDSHLDTLNQPIWANPVLIYKQEVTVT